MNEEDYNIFTQKNNVNLNNEIDSLSFKDINLRDGFIKISETTPFIYQKLGLKNLPVHVYIQKLARALFLEKESYGERRTHGHKNEFSIKEMKSVFENISNPRYIFNSKQNFYDSEKLTLIGVYDEFDKYENPMIITICFDKNRYSTEVNWVTSIYGKNKDVIINDWTEKGYLLYKNDVEIKKASEEVVTLYMRISKSSNAYKNNILLKSQLVNENTNASIENDNGEFLYDASHSTIEKGLFLESKEDISYIYSEEFISKFGNWEKANRLEKFRLTGSIKKDEKIILNGSDITSTVESLIENEDKKKHPNIEKYLYFGTGLNLSGEEYTCKSVIGVDSSKNCYYDQSLSTIAKGKLIDYILQNKKSGNLSPLITQRETGLEGNEMPYVYYDKRLINICQVPQMPYLELITNGCQRKKLSRL